MRTFAECIPCFLRQTVETLRAAGLPDSRVEAAVREVARRCSELDLSVPPPVFSREVYRIARRETGIADPFRDIKRRYNEMALSMLPRFEALVAASPAPFDAAVRLAIAGNIIDLGAKSGLTEEEAFRVVDAALHAPLDGDPSDLEEAVASAGKILYLADNAGEIVFDRLLLAQLPLDRVTIIVRGAPIINDATMEDARQAGLDRMARVLDNGTDAPGSVLDNAPAETLRAFAEADLVISKGQGNYETVSAAPGKGVFYLLKVKCPVIARDVGCPVGAMVVRRAVAVSRDNAEVLPRYAT